MANLVALLVGATLAAVDWYPQHLSHQLAASAASQTPTLPSSVLTVRDVKAFPDGTHLYDVIYNVQTKNSSSRPVTITYSIAELYVGAASDLSLGMHQGYELNDLPTPWDKSSPGPIAWQRVNYDSSWVDGGPPDAVRRFFAAKGLEDRSDGGGLTGSLAPGDSTGIRPEFFLRARPGEYIGVVVSYGIGDAVRSPDPDINLTSDFQRAPQGTAPATSKAATPGARLAADIG